MSLRLADTYIRRRNNRQAVPVQVKRFLNDERNRSGIIGVIASGNTNFGEAYGIAGDIIALNAACRYSTGSN